MTWYTFIIMLAIIGGFIVSVIAERKEIKKVIELECSLRDIPHSERSKEEA